MRCNWLERWSVLAMLVLFAAACGAAQQQRELDAKFGKASVQNREIASEPAHAVDYWTEVQPILQRRCVVCHGCYDAPCQLKLEAVEGVERGGSKEKVYDSGRLLAGKLTRLFEDASSTAEWRELGFHPVLNERENMSEANKQGSVLYQMLALKRQHPLPRVRRLEGFDFSIDREQTCATIEEFPDYSEKHPLGGMPYGLPSLSDAEFSTLERWLVEGSVYAARAPVPTAEQQKIDEWEAYLNRDGAKSALVGRYLFEHWFLAHLYFPELTKLGETPAYFEMVRSSTPPGTPVKRISSRRPFDDPKSARVYYRLLPLPSATLSKTHMPYALDSERRRRLDELFYEAPFKVETLPDYDPERSANPFMTFVQLPVRSRYSFMLDEARYILEGFIKGPVCRGQAALNVINDRFWVTFLDPKTITQAEADFYAREIPKLDLPAGQASSAMILANWVKYSRKQDAYLKAKTAYLNQRFEKPRALTLDLIWDGDGKNPNAALTVFRHEDSATVVQGLVGTPPKTAWVVGYGLLERIHYLLVAGFDVYGNAGHQLNTRLYMDFLRMEAEANFLGLLPKAVRNALRDEWYEGAEDEAREYINGTDNTFSRETGIHYASPNPKLELYDLLGARMAKVNSREHRLSEQDPEDLLRMRERLEGQTGGPVKQFPQMSVIRLQADDGSFDYVTLLRDNAHSNISSLLSEQDNRRPDRDRFTLAHGILGAYPNALFVVQRNELSAFIDAVLSQTDETSYDALRDRYGVRRTSPTFWAEMDALHLYLSRSEPIHGGLLDLNRLENR